MAVKIEFDKKSHKATVSEPESVSSLVRGHFGKMSRGTITLFAEEALYLIDIRNASCADKSGRGVGFNQVAAACDSGKLMAKYFTYKDWRDRGLIARPAHEACGPYGKDRLAKYPREGFRIERCKPEGLFFADDLVTLIDDEDFGRALYHDYWLGQFGTYKADGRGKLSKLDIYETVFLAKHAKLKLANATLAKAIKAARQARPDFDLMYAVYEDWRLAGYVLKTGFKFGCHFRLYLPGASPKADGEKWMHSKHVVQVFPRANRLLISEWARAIRVAHSVKKTFILAIPGRAKKEARAGFGKKRSGAVGLDFALYHRKKGNIENPKEDSPSFMMLSLSEEEYIGGEQLAGALSVCRGLGLDLMLAIADRETAVTYYSVRRIELPKSKYEYFEIEWQLP
ncbi:tRNA-intron lyase [Candidatus Parvarchaeota archaeon]|nr:tRNA-intron lyase [Candidatus Parvarchaeota archaeon]